MRLGDHLLAIARTAVAATPIGSAVCTLINEYVPSAHDVANERAAEILFHRLNSLGSRINAEYVRCDKFVDLYKNCVVIVQRSQFEEKYEAVARILSNALLNEGDSEKIEYDELAHFSRCVESLTLASCHWLGKIIHVSKRNTYRTDFGSVSAVSPTVDIDLLMGLLKELENQNLGFVPKLVFDDGG